MARDNRLWGAERIRGELLKLGIHVTQRTIQKYMRAVRTTRPHEQTWRTFARRPSSSSNCTRARVIHVGVTRSPTDAWTAQQRSSATAFGVGPKYLIRDNDSKFGVAFARVAQASGIKILKTPYHAKRPNAICERFVGSVRRECLDHLLILQEKQLHRVLRANVKYFNQARPQEAHQTADSGEICRISASTACKWQGHLLPGPGRVAS